MVGFVAGGLAGSTARAAAPATPTRPADGAVMVGWHEAGDDPDDLRLHESELGTRFALVRMYQQWQLPSRRVTEMINDGRLVLVSHKPPATGGWAAVASGAEDAMIRKLAEAYRAFGREVLFSFHHEPHDDASDVKGGTAGTTADYLAAWRRIRRVFDEVRASHSAGGKVFFAYSATGSWALMKAKSGGPAGSGDPLYPGDDLIDVFAHDRYNWGSCRGDAWEEFSSEWAPLVALAAAHRKPLLAAEFGSPPADGARNDWFRRAADWLRTDPLARKWFWGFAYFHTLHDTCPWDFLNQGDDGRLGWQDGFRHSYFTGTPFSLASGQSTPILEGATNPAPAPTAAPTPLKPVAPKPSTTTTKPPTTTTTTKPSTTTSSPPASGAAAPGPAVADPAAPAAPDTATAPPAPAPDPAPLTATPDAAGEQAINPAKPPPSPTNGTALATGLAAVLALALVARRLTGA